LRTLRECILNGLRMRGEHVYAGAINRTPKAADGLPKCGKRIAIMQRTPTKHPQTHHKKHTFGFLKHHSYKTQTIVAQNENGIFFLLFKAQ
ncbi:hypothetical protein, partial [Prevotella pallens]